MVSNAKYKNEAGEWVDLVLPSAFSLDAEAVRLLVHIGELERQIAELEEAIAGLQHYAGIGGDG